MLRFSRTVSILKMPSFGRSAGTAHSPASIAACGLNCGIALPSTSTVPTRSRRPDSRLASSSRPDPVRPAMPTTSPGWTSRSNGASSAPPTPRRLSTGATSVGRGSTRWCAAVSATSTRPSIRLARPSWVSDAVDSVAIAPAVAQHRHPVGDLQDLVEVVGDEQHGGAPLGHATHRREQAGDLRAGQRGGGLVEDEQRELLTFAGAVEGSGHADRGALGLGQLADGARRVDVVAEAVQRPAGGLALVAAVEQRQARHPPGDPEVVGDGHRLDEAEVLVDEAQPGVERIGGRAEVERDAGHLGGGTLVGFVVAGEDLDDRRLARAVLADEGVDLAGGDLQVDVVQRPLPGERLRQVDDPQGSCACLLSDIVGQRSGPPFTLASRVTSRTSPP